MHNRFAQFLGIHRALPIARRWPAPMGKLLQRQNGRPEEILCEVRKQTSTLNQHGFSNELPDSGKSSYTR